MKRKSIFTFCAIAWMLVLSLSVLTACNKDGKHNFAEELSNNETHHWHACADKGCKEIKDKAEHSWNDGSVSVEPTTPSFSVVGSTETLPPFQECSALSLTSLQPLSAHACQ